MKHYPHWDFRMYNLHQDPYAYWNSYTPIYYGTDTVPISYDPWSKGSRLVNNGLLLIIGIALSYLTWTKKLRRRDIILIQSVLPGKIVQDQFR